jgi:predicted transcriptional regulator
MFIFPVLNVAIENENTVQTVVDTLVTDYANTISKKGIITMKDYDEIRKRYLAGESQRHIAKALGISRNTVAKYCEGEAVPWERKTPERVSTVLTDETVAFIRACLQEDEGEGLKKQCHTAKRI